MKLNDLVLAAQILQKYYNNPNGRHVGADHDQIYFYKVDKPITQDDIDKLTDLGLFQPYTTGKNYNPEDGWSVYT